MPEGMITADDTVYDIIIKFPLLKAALIFVSHKFSRFQKPQSFEADRD